MSPESKVNKDKPWLSQIVVDSENQQKVLEDAGKASKNLSNKWRGKHKPQIPTQRNHDEWKELC
jgi:hypothetical protein